MHRNSVYVTFVIADAFLGERVMDYGVNKLWEYNNVGDKNTLEAYRVSYTRAVENHPSTKSGVPKMGAKSSKIEEEKICIHIYLRVIVRKRYEDIPVLGQRQSEE